MAKTSVRSAQITDGTGVDLTVDVFGILPIANGGTGSSTGSTGGGPQNFVIDGGSASTVYPSTSFRIDFGGSV